MPLPLVLLIVFGSAKLLAEIFETLGQPGIAGEVLAGVVIGPSLLGWIQPELIQPGGLVSSLGEIGVMFLLFRVGLEVKSPDLWKIGRTAALVAACGVVLSFALVWGTLTLWGVRAMEAAFASAGLAATSAGITAQVLSARGLLSARAAQVVLAAAVIDDICGLLLLAVVSSAAAGVTRILRGWCSPSPDPYCLLRWLHVGARRWRNRYFRARAAGSGFRKPSSRWRFVCCSRWRCFPCGREFLPLWAHFSPDSRWARVRTRVCGPWCTEPRSYWCRSFS